MADDIAITAGTGTTVGADNISSVYYQRIKLIHGVDGTNDGDAANTNGFPVKSSYVTATLQNAVSATGNGSSLSVLGMGTAVLTVTGTFSATVTFEGTEDGSTWVGITALCLDLGVLAVITTTTGTFVVPCAGLQSVRARVTWTSGTSVTVTGHAVSAPWPLPTIGLSMLGSQTIAANAGNASSGTLRVVVASDQAAVTVKGGAADGAAVSGNPVLIAGQDGTNAQSINTDTTGRIINVGAAAAGAAIAGNPVLMGGSDGTNARAIKTDTGGQVFVIPGTAAADLGKAEDAAHTTGDVGVMALAVRASSPTERSAGPTDGDYEPLATNEVGALWTTNTPSANGGASTINSTSSDGGTALTNSAQVIKAGAGTLLGYYIYNPNATAQFVCIYNTAAASVTVGTTNPLFMLTIPAASAANLTFTYGVAFSTAMSWAAASTAGGNGAPTTALDAVCWYK